MKVSGHMATKIRLADGREVTIALDGKRVVETLQTGAREGELFVRFSTPAKTRVWVSPSNVVCIEDRPDLD